MKNRLNLALIVLLLMCLVGWAGSAHAQRDVSPNSQHWEYLVFSPVPSGPPLQEQMNYLGAHGWELVSTQPAKSGGVELVGGQPSASTIYYFKRLK